MISKTLGQIAAQQAIIPWMTCLGLLIFFTFFIAMLFWISGSERVDLYKQISHLPFANEKKDQAHREMKS